MGLKRREFLQRASLALGALGINEAGWWRLQSRYLEALAETTGGKLAFLVGINEYPDQPLSGCVTDVEMQKELLVNRFGFLPADIFTLTNKQATRENIETAFINHLTNQAKPDDLVLFHFSGYGSRVSKMIDEDEHNELITSNLTSFQNSLVPIDGTPPNNNRRPRNDVLEETLWLLLRSLPTRKVVTILDTSYVYPGRNLQGVLRIRSRPSSTTEPINIKEKAMQMELRNQQNLLGEQESYEREFPGVILNASQESQFATETDWNGFSSGLFTYALTQNLWSTTPATRLQMSFSQAASSVEKLTGANQQPEFKEAKQQTIAQSTKVAAITPVTINSQNILSPVLPPASGVVTSVEDNGKAASIWLGGLPINVLDTVTSNSLFTTIPNFDSNFNFKLQIRSRSGLNAKASVIVQANSSQESLKRSDKNTNNQTERFIASPELLTGTLVREKIRVLPQPMDLMIALDSNLSRIERVDATSGFSAIPQVTVVANTQSADYVFSRVRETSITQSSSAPLSSIYQGRYGLFSLGQMLIPNSIGEGGEAVKVAAQRLSSPLKTLLAAKILGLTKNESSTQIKVKANLVTITPGITREPKIIMHRETLGISDGEKFPTNLEDVSNFGVSQELLTLPIGSQIQYRLYNDGARPVYFMLLILDSSGRIFAIDPKISNQVGDKARPSQTGLVISPRDSINMPPVMSKSPRETGTFGWRLTSPEGLAKSLIFCSYQPFEETIVTLNEQLSQVGDDLLIKEVSNPLAVAEAILRDLQGASKLAIQSSGLSTDDYTLDINSWATLNFVYRVV
ncbi:caspase family protein [Okeania sp.]|uniref:caspase family protein n=1 Tax=Okeania sp. TaxID=3100323 RepID=UPI002B4B41B8|nr:caspase family protein [Okeania sp.]MEB3339281.1 caspase family protein [Okeania sp.]